MCAWNFPTASLLTECLKQEKKHGAQTGATPAELRGAQRSTVCGKLALHSPHAPLRSLSRRRTAQKHLSLEQSVFL